MLVITHHRLMLADLDQSKQLMDKFCDSELLEGLDMVLAGSRLHAPQRVSGLPQLVGQYLLCISISNIFIQSGSLMPTGVLYVLSVLHIAYKDVFIPTEFLFHVSRCDWISSEALIL